MKNHITTKVSVNCITEKDAKVLLVQEAIGKIRGLWSVPGGKIDGVESFKEVAKREVKEETNLNALKLQKISIIQEKPNYTVKHIFKAKTEGTLKAQEDEILDVQYFSLKEIKEMKNQLRKP